MKLKHQKTTQTWRKIVLWMFYSYWIENKYYNLEKKWSKLQRRHGDGTIIRNGAILRPTNATLIFVHAQILRKNWHISNMTTIKDWRLRNDKGNQHQLFYKTTFGPCCTICTLFCYVCLLLSKYARLSSLQTLTQRWHNLLSMQTLDSNHSQG